MGEFARKNLVRMLRIAQSFLRDDALAEDAVQNAFGPAFFRLDQYEGVFRIRSFIGASLRLKR
ncbi:MAG: hypothetical protein AAF667_01180 [Pseudomonadota bacterium]